MAYAFLVTSTIAPGSITRVDTARALAVEGVFAVICHQNAPLLQEAEGELAVFQSPRVAYRGQIVAATIADTLEAARQGAGRVEIAYEEQPPDWFSPRRPGALRTTEGQSAFDTDTEEGDVDARSPQRQWSSTKRT